MKQLQPEVISGSLLTYVGVCNGTFAEGIQHVAYADGRRRPVGEIPKDL